MTKERKIKVLVVEDSDVMRMHLVHMLNSDPQIQVIGTAANGRAALEFLARNSPDAILMDIEMPVMGGFEATRRIMESKPYPIVICSGSSNPEEAMTAFRSMEAGAVAFVPKPVGNGNENFEAAAAHLRETVKLMAEVRVVRRWPHFTDYRAKAASDSLPCKPIGQTRLIGIGASTGGPPILQTVLSSLPKDFPVPILVVQHIASGFLEGLTNWLNQTTGLKIQIASYGVQPMPGQVYFAPDDFHMSVRQGGEIALSKDSPDNGLRPSVNRLFRSLADVCGPSAIGVLLTGMGKDGAEGLKRMNDAGAVTIAQDRETSVVHGMPGEAIALGAASHVLAADKIASALVAEVGHMAVVK
jgi:two-component system chemotaxis response regulator CheB